MKIILMTAIMALILGACSTKQELPALYFSLKTLGISVDPAPVGGAPGFTFGSKITDLAIVPLTVANAEGGRDLITSTHDCTWAPAPNANGDYEFACEEDAISVLGQYNVKAKNSGVSLGNFFSVGAAAFKLGVGFGERVKTTGATNEPE